MKEELDCTKCGACCIDQLIVIMPKDNVPLLMRDGNVMRKQLDRCIALRGRVGKEVLRHRRA